VFRALFDYPILLGTIQALIAVLVLLWAAMARFGAPASPRPALESGKSFLIENIATLLRFGGHGGHALTRYLNHTTQELRARLHAPAGLDERGLRDWLARCGAARGAEMQITELEEEVRAIGAHGRVPPPYVIRAARRIHEWKEEMIHGRVEGS
jgi:hypothetical protein